MSEPRERVHREFLLAAAEACPSGLLGKLACVSREFQEACEAEARRRARSRAGLPPVSLRLLSTAAEIDWAVSCGLRPDSRLAMALVAGGSVPALNRAAELGMPLPPGLCALAAFHGKLEALKWLRSRGAFWNERACSEAAWNGHLDVLVWLRSHGAPWDEDVCGYAAKRGHLDALKWAWAEGAPRSGFACAYAAQGGNLDVLVWLRAQGAEWNEYTAACAAGGGHLEVLKWARDNGCPWDADTCFEAARVGRLDVLKWALDNGAPWDERTRRLLRGSP